MSSEMMDKLNALARQNHVKREPDIVLDDHPAVRYRSGVKQQMEQPAADTPSHSALDFLEQNLYRYSGRVYSGKAEEIRLVQAVNPAEEISCVVREIGKLLREGYRYRDMAVITGDIGSFAGELIHQFDASEIPYFLDDKKSILKNPMVELVRAALETIQKDFSYETVFRYLRTGLVTKPEDERRLDRLENYVIAMGIRGLKRWNTTWEGWYRGGRDLNLEELNQLREEIMAPLTAFIEARGKDGAHHDGGRGPASGGALSGGEDAGQRGLISGTGRIWACQRIRSGVRPRRRSDGPSRQALRGREGEPQGVRGDSGRGFFRNQGRPDPGGRGPDRGGRYYENASRPYQDSVFYRCKRWNRAAEEGKQQPVYG